LEPRVGDGAERGDEGIGRSQHVGPFDGGSNVKVVPSPESQVIEDTLSFTIPGSGPPRTYVRP
jgi:hypothetical protein